MKKLAQTECEYPNIKKAFLFSCLTGLRRSDILKLTWGEVHEQGEYTRIIFKQKKTGGLEYLDITPQAAELMDKRGKPNASVFGDKSGPLSGPLSEKRPFERHGGRLKNGLKKTV